MEEKKKNCQKKVELTNVEEQISDEEMAKVQGGCGIPYQGTYVPESGGISINNPSGGISINNSSTTIKIGNPKI